MIIKLKGATFSNNINGLLNSWPITFYGRTLVTGTFVSSVSKGSTYTATFSVADKCTVDSVVVTRGGTTMSGATISGNTISISVPTTAESGPISITFNGSKENGDDPVIPDVPVEPDVPAEPTSNYTLVHGNKYASGNENNTARATIFPYTIVVPQGVTIKNKSTIKWAYYRNVNVNTLPNGTGNGTWGDYTYTGNGEAVGIAFKKVDDSAFDWSVDSNNPADYFDVSDPGLWNGTAVEVPSGPSTPSETPDGTVGDITALTLVDGNPWGTAAQQTAKNRVHSETALYCPAGTTISCKDTTTYKWAIKKVASETNLTSTESSYRPDSAWTTKKSYTTETNGYWCFILLKASDANFDWSVDSNKVSDYFTVS